MRAKFVNEKFEEHSDPVGDLGIGIKAQLDKSSLKVKKHQSTQGNRIAKYISNFVIASEENIFLIDHRIATQLLKKYKSDLVKFVSDQESGFGMAFTLRELYFEDDNTGWILMEQNAWAATYWGDIKAAIKAYELENLTDS